MGTTVVTAVVVEDACYIGHVGDSRAYLIRDGEIRQLTRDHTFVNEQVEKAQAGELLEHELAHLREELDAMDAKGGLSAELKVLRRTLAEVQPISPGSGTSFGSPRDRAGLTG